MDLELTLSIIAKIVIAATKNSKLSYLLFKVTETNKSAIFCEKMIGEGHIRSLLKVIRTVQV